MTIEFKKCHTICYYFIVFTIHPTTYLLLILALKYSNDNYANLYE